MQKFYAERETSGPEFDDRLIRLVRKNPAIYDVNHPHYRRNPVRIAIWERIATELGAPSKFIQTKWKNIRYNYLQEIKSLETGFPNANIRKRRFTEDLSFLQNTAQSYTPSKRSAGKVSNNGSDNESNGFIYPDNAGGAFEIIEIDHSNDGVDDEQNDVLGAKQTFNIDSAAVTAKIEINNDQQQDANSNAFIRSMQSMEPPPPPIGEPKPDVTIEQTFTRKKSPNTTETTYSEIEEPPSYGGYSNSSSPLLTPMVVMGNGYENETNGFNDEVTIEPIVKPKNKNINRFYPNTTLPAVVDNNSIKPKIITTPTYSEISLNDPIELYCMSLVDTLRSMPRSERERVKFEFAKILKDAKYKDQS